MDAHIEVGHAVLLCIQGYKISQLDSMYTLAYTYNATYFKEDFARIDAYERRLLEDKIAPIGGEYVIRVTQEQWKSIITSQGGLHGPLKWYKANMRGINTADEEGKKISTRIFLLCML